MKSRFQQLIEEKTPFVIYQKPNSNCWVLWEQNNSTLHTYNKISNVSGFVFQSFLSDKKIIFPEKECKITTLNPELSHLTEQSEIIPIKNSIEEKNQHIQTVQQAIDNIKNENTSLQKVVISRREEIKNTLENPFENFKKLCFKYPTAFVYWWFHPEEGMWAGATPEQFLKIKNDELSTVSLAGTQLLNNKTPEEIIWKTKEQKEQQIVTDFIVNILEKHTENLTISTPYTHQAGNLVHIKTDIRTHITEKTSLDTLIAELHPTPALCGYPKEEAFRFITTNENYPRENYGGFLGEWNIQNEKNTKSDLFVNLRCMQIKNHEIFIYIGGGINEGSDAEAEYDETLNKSQTIKNIL